MMDSRKELKSAAVSTSFVNTVAGSVGPLTQQIIEGVGVNQRIGDEIFAKELRLNLSILGGVGSTQSFHRFIIFQDMQNTGVLPTVGNVLDAGLYNSTYAILFNQQGRFKILYDKMFGIVAGANSNATHVQIKLKPSKRIQYNGATSATAANGPGSIWYLALTDSVVVATATLSFYANLIYTDA